MCTTLKSYTYCCDIQPNGFGKLKMIIQYTYPLQYVLYFYRCECFFQATVLHLSHWQVPTDAYSPMGVTSYQEQALQYYLKVCMFSMSTSTHFHEQ